MPGSRREPGRLGAGQEFQDGCGLCASRCVHMYACVCMCVYTSTCVYVCGVHVPTYTRVTDARSKPLGLANKLFFTCLPSLFLSLPQIQPSEFLFLSIQRALGCLPLPSLAGSGPLLCVPQLSKFPPVEMKWRPGLKIPQGETKPCKPWKQDEIELIS